MASFGFGIVLKLEFHEETLFHKGHFFTFPYWRPGCSYQGRWYAKASTPTGQVEIPDSFQSAVIEIPLTSGDP